MRKKLNIILTVVAILLLAISVFYLWANHEYDLVKVEDIKTDKDYIGITYDKQEDIWDDDVLGIIYIDKIGLAATVKEGSTNEVLKEYIGHISETSKYDGNIGLAAHNRANKYSYFARINELEKGDIIIYKTKFYERKYKVYKKCVILETDWRLLQNSQTNKLTLLTCIAGKKNQRLCVQANQV